MKAGMRKIKQMAGMIIALVLLVNGFYAPVVSAAAPEPDAQPCTLMTIYPELTTPDGRITVKLCLTYQESTGKFTGASVQQITSDTSVKFRYIMDVAFSDDMTTVYVHVHYDYVEDGQQYGCCVTLTKSVP